MQILVLSPIQPKCPFAQIHRSIRPHVHGPNPCTFVFFTALKWLTLSIVVVVYSYSDEHRGVKTKHTILRLSAIMYSQICNFMAVNSNTGNSK